jgi:hypothetical protein
MATGVAVAPADSPFGVPTPGISGQIRLRTEFDHKRLADPAPGTRMWTLERARLGYQVAPNEAFAIQLEIQDNRVMGSEPDNGVYDQSRLSATSSQVFGAQTSSAHDLIYVGERITGKWGSFVLEEEFTWQAGELALYGAKDVSSAAFQAALRLGWHDAKGKVNGGVDVIEWILPSPHRTIR